MRARMYAVIVTLGLACVTTAGPQVLRMETPRPAGDAYTTVLQELAAMGYQVTAGDRDAGYVRAEKQREPPGFTFAVAFYDLLYVAVVPGQGAGTTVQVTASTDVLPADKHRRPEDHPSKQVLADADRLLARFK